MNFKFFLRTAKDSSSERFRISICNIDLEGYQTGKMNREIKVIEYDERGLREIVAGSSRREDNG